MPLFKCGYIDNTALSTYWFRNTLEYTGDLAKYQGLSLCSECGMADGSKIVQGKWHGRFPKEKATPETEKHLINCK